jgi:hypothetical protein
MEGISLHKYCILSYNAALSSDVGPTKKGVARQPVRRPQLCYGFLGQQRFLTGPRQPVRAILPFGLLISLDVDVTTLYLSTKILIARITL